MSDNSDAENVPSQSTGYRRRKKLAEVDTSDSAGNSSPSEVEITPKRSRRDRDSDISESVDNSLMLNSESGSELTTDSTQHSQSPQPPIAAEDPSMSESPASSSESDLPDIDEVFEEYNNPEIHNVASSDPESDLEDVISTEEELNLDSQDEDEEYGGGGGGPAYDPPLYRGAPLTVAQSVLAILTYVIAHKCTGVGLADLLGLIALHCIAEDNMCKKSLYRFKKYFKDMGNSPLIIHYFCPTCFKLVGSKSENCLTQGCNNEEAKCYFIEVSVIGQLRFMFKRAGFWNKLNYRFERVKKNPNAFEDIYDGRLYTSKVQDGFLSQHSNISFLWNTDGMSVFKSAKFEVWPFYLSINELPYCERFKKENTVVAGLWFGQSKPKLPLFLNALHTDLGDLYRGVRFDVFDQHNEEMVKAALLCGTCDTPAKAHFLNIISHNGYYGCPKCTVRGERSERTSGKHAYPYSEAPLRTQDDTDRNARLATNFDTVVYGVKGRSAIGMFVNDYVVSTSIDVMHCVYQGVMKTLMRFWFDDEFSHSNFSLCAVRDAVSKIFIKLTPPAYIRRLPRSISETLKLWKASEFKAFLFYYSLPVLSRVLSPEYFNHLALLVHAIYLLNTDSISEADINEAEVCLKEFVMKFQDLYGLEYLSINFHLLLHLPENVRNLGPLWASSCMPFEDLNGQLKRLVHGTTHAALQITSSLGQVISLPILLDKLDRQDHVRLWCENILNKKRLSVNEVISDSLCTVGKYVYLINLPPIIFNALNDIGALPSNVSKFFRLKKGRHIYTSEAYTRTKATYSSAVRFILGNGLQYGVIHCFVRVSDCNCNVGCRCAGEFYAIISRVSHVNPFKIAFPNITLTYILECTLEDSVAVSVKNLRELCVCLRANEKLYIMKPVNTLEDE